jgi:eukaryotic-like serine/threonine-protein kinase
MIPGEIIDGTYVVERLLGEGGMGVVAAARHISTGAVVAIKVLKSDSADGTHFRRFLREIRGVSQLCNEHVARVVAFGELQNRRPYMAMELLDGPDLSSMLHVAPLPARVAALYVMQACAGLGEAHALGIVHRDIKPANLMLSRNAMGVPIIKVVDFGIATAPRHDDEDEITAAHTVIGSVCYMSPEQLRAAADLDARSDVWSLGVTLYELISGRLPFDRENFAATAIAIAGDDDLPLPEADPALAAIIARCLAKNPRDRYASVDELADALAPIAGVVRQATAITLRMKVPRITTSSELAGQATTVPMFMLRSPAGWIAAAAALVIALVGFGALAFSGKDVEASTTIARPAIQITPVSHITVKPIAQPTVTPIEVAPEPVIELAPIEPVVEAAPAKRIAKPAGKRVAKRAVAKRATKKKSTCNPRDPRCLL